MQCCRECVTKRQLIWAIIAGYVVSVIVSVSITLCLRPVVSQPNIVQQVNVGMEQHSLARDIGVQYKKEKENGL